MITYFTLSPFKIGPFLLTPWGVAVFLAFLTAFLLTLFRARQLKIELTTIIDLLILSLIGGIIGSRAWVVIEYRTYFAAHPNEIFYVWQGGMAFFGGFLLSLLLLFLFIRKKHLSFTVIADLVAPALPLAMAIGRIGNFLSGHHLGSITTVPWAISLNGRGRHPIALYEMLLDFLIVGAVLLLERRKPKPGTLFLLFIFCYSLGRFFLDFLRNNDLPNADPRLLIGLTGAQIVSACSVLIILIITFMRRYKK